MGFYEEVAPGAFVTKFQFLIGISNILFCIVTGISSISSFQFLIGISNMNLSINGKLIGKT